MRRRFSRIALPSLALVSVWIGVVACAPKTPNTPEPPVTEAYRLMDKGDNEKAALLLEDVLQKEPNNREAKILLASAYMGEAGVDIYKLHDTFKDVIFNTPLSDRFFARQGTTKDLFGDTPSSSKSKKADEEEVTPDSPLNELVGNTDRILLTTRKVVEFLDRFPNVPKEKWTLLDSGLELLDGSGEDRDLCLYRIFFRVIYLKAYLSQEFLRDPDAGRKEWLCAIDLSNLRESLDWVLKHVSSASDDFRQVFPKKSQSINSFQAITEALKDELDDLNRSTSGANTSLVVLQEQFRSSLRCGE